MMLHEGRETNIMKSLIIVFLKVIKSRRIWGGGGVENVAHVFYSSHRAFNSGTKGLILMPQISAIYKSQFTLFPTII
jgi:hypothetical protein